METLPGKFEDALKGMRSHERLASEKLQEQRLRAVMDGAHPDIVGGWKPSTKWTPSEPRYSECRGFVPVFLRRMDALGVPMFAYCIWRSFDEQEAVRKAGNSKAGAGGSPHQYGCAVDLIHSIRGWGLNKQQWAVIGHVGKEVAASLGLRVVWGGDWDFYDPAHFEVKDWRDVRRVFQSNPAIKTVDEALEVLAKERSQS